MADVARAISALRTRSVAPSKADAIAADFIGAPDGCDCGDRIDAMILNCLFGPKPKRRTDPKHQGYHEQENGNNAEWRIPAQHFDCAKPAHQRNPQHVATSRVERSFPWHPSAAICSYRSKRVIEVIRPMIDARKLMAIAIMLPPMAAHGQPGAVSAQFAGVLQAPQHRDAVLQAAKQSTTWIKHGCSSGTFKPLPTVKMWKPARFGANGSPVEGVWGETIEANGCGMTRILNVATIVRSPGVLVTQVLAPGETKADPLLQQDASRFVFSAGLAGTGCRQAFIDDTKAVGQEPASSVAGLVGPVEIEQWTLIACDRNITVEVQFLPRAGKTEIVAHPLSR
jgi:hypothetical protein